MVLVIQSLCLFLMNSVVFGSGTGETALFYRRPRESNGGPNTVQSSKMVADILQWIQSRYTDLNRKERGDLSRGYLPQFNPTSEAPRPFEVPSTPKYEDVTNVGVQVDFGQHDGTHPVLEYSTTVRPNEVTINHYGTVGAQNEDNVVTIGGTVAPQNDVNFGQFGQTPSNEVNVGQYDNFGRPHVHSLSAICTKTSMEIHIEFSEPFNGVLYSKGYRTNPQCNFISPGTGQTKYSFTLQLDSCGTEFISAEPQSFLESHIVIQSEPDVVEEWDSIRTLRCTWDSVIPQSLSSELSVAGLEHSYSNFSGDSGAASLALLPGHVTSGGSGLEITSPRVGDAVTLLVQVRGDAALGVQIGSCDAIGGPGEGISLTDGSGCPLRPKLFSGFKFGRNSVGSIAYAHFKAFKFPETDAVTFSCRVDLCKYKCLTCGSESGPIRRKKRNAVTFTATYNIAQLP